MVLRLKLYRAYRGEISSQSVAGNILRNEAVEGDADSATILVPTLAYQVLKVTGANLTYANNGLLNGGTVTRVEAWTQEDQKIYEIDGFALTPPVELLEANPVWNVTSEMTEAADDGRGAFFFGGAGGDTIVGSPFEDRFLGEDGADSIVGGAGIDILTGGKGNDTIQGGRDVDYIFGDRGNDEIDGGPGADMLVYHPYRVDQTVDLGKGTHKGSKLGTDALTSIESFFGGFGDDIIAGSDRANTLVGYYGDDSITAKGGNDEIWVGNGQDTVSGGAGADLFVFSINGTGSGDVARLTDFGRGDDRLGIEDTSLAAGPLAASRFRNGSNARDADDLVIYSRATGRLWIDRDGDGGGQKILVATLTTKPVLAADDFVIVQQPSDWSLL